MKKRLKIDFHMHSNNEDNIEADLSQKQIVDFYIKNGFDAIAITEHNIINYDKNLAKYAKKKGLLLVPGVEVRIKQGDVLIINPNKKEIKKKLKKDLPENFEDLRKIKSKNNLIIAAHPYLLFAGIGEKEFLKNKDVFDAVEYNGFAGAFWFFNWNKKAKHLAMQCKKPIIANSDAHFKVSYGATYSLINSRKNIKDIIKNVKKGKIMIFNKPLKNNFRNYLIFIPVLVREIIKFTERFINYVIKNNNHG